MLKKKFDWKELGIDLLVDLAAGMLGAVGIYNFALNANFPVAGFSGIAIICYHLFKIPVGIGTILLNIPVAIFCYKFLGKNFFLKSVKSMIISSAFIWILISSRVVTASSVAIAAIGRSFFAGACHVYRDLFVVKFSTVQFVNGFLACCIVRHFYETETSGSSCFSVCNDSCRRNFSVL